MKLGLLEASLLMKAIPAPAKNPVRSSILAGRPQSVPFVVTVTTIVTMWKEGEEKTEERCRANHLVGKSEVGGAEKTETLKNNIEARAPLLPSSRFSPEIL